MALVVALVYCPVLGLSVLPLSERPKSIHLC